MSEQPTTTDERAAACPIETGPEQILYARVLHVGMAAGLVLLAVTFVVYAFGIMEPYVPREELPRYYSMPVEQYLEQANVAPGWGSFFEFAYSDFLCYLGLLVLAGLAMVCQLAILPLLLRRRDLAYAAMAALQIVVLALVASGVLTGGR
jgi:hypothetical protein